MIQINCTNCQAVLTIDDAFAGGVCRCRYCGTIQTVPKHLKAQGQNGDGGNAGSGSGVVAAVAGAKAPKTLYQKKAAVADPGIGPSGTGLDDLANIVASSGLSSSRLRKPDGAAQGRAPGGPAGPAPAGAPKAPNRNLVLIVSGAGAIIALLLGVIVFMAVRDRAGDGGAGGGAGDGGRLAGDTGGQGGPVRVGPRFAGMPIAGDTVIYVLDRGQATVTDGRLDRMKEAACRSAETLGPERKFQIIFWTADKDPYTFPPSGPQPATADNISAARQALMNDVTGFGQTRMNTAMEKAFRSRPDAIVLVPVKTFLDNVFHTAITKMRSAAQARTRVYCVSIDQPELGDVLRKIAQDTGGEYRDVSLQQLRTE